MPILSNIPVVLAAGALIAFAVYRRSAKRTAHKRTAHDLRTELRAEQESLRATLAALSAQIDLAKRSRAAAALAAGTGPEGLQQWRCGLDLDWSEVERLRSQLPAADFESESMPDMDVDIKLVEVLALSLRASALGEKYNASIFLQETDRESFSDDADLMDDSEADAPVRKASQHSFASSASPIAESVV